MTDKQAKKLSGKYFSLTELYKKNKISVGECIREQNRIADKLERAGFIYLNGLEKFVKVI